MTPLLLTAEELVSLTGYRRAGDQVRELQRQGFTRARRGPSGDTVLERAHYESVCRGMSSAERPRVRPPQLRRAA